MCLVIYAIAPSPYTSKLEMYHILFGLLIIFHLHLKCSIWVLMDTENDIFHFFVTASKVTNTCDLAILL